MSNTAPKAPTAAPATPQPQAQGAPAQAKPNTATPTQAQQQQQAAAERKLKLKLDGKEVEMHESEVVALAQRGKVANQRFEEAAAMRKQAEQVLQYAKNNPSEFFAKTGMNARQWAEQYLMEELRREQMSPEQRKAAENEAKLRQYEAEKKAQAEKQRAEQEATLRNKYVQDYNQMFVKALAESGLPATPFTVKRMADLQLINIKNGYELDASQLSKLVREDYISEQKNLFGAMEGEQLMDILGPEVVKRLSKAQIAKLKGKSAPSKPQATQSQGNQPELTWDEYKKRNRRR